MNDPSTTRSRVSQGRPSSGGALRRSVPAGAERNPNGLDRIPVRVERVASVRECVPICSARVPARLEHVPTHPECIPSCLEWIPGRPQQGGGLFSTPADAPGRSTVCRSTQLTPDLSRRARRGIATGVSPNA